MNGLEHVVGRGGGVHPLPPNEPHPPTPHIRYESSPHVSVVPITDQIYRRSGYRGLFFDLLSLSDLIKKSMLFR